MDFVKKPCKHCPFRKDVTPYLHPDRAAEIVYEAQNPYTSFPCHKTTEPSDDEDESRVTSHSQECAGFLTMRDRAGEDVPEGFEPSDLCYDDDIDMIDAYEREWYGKRGKRYTPLIE